MDLNNFDWGWMEQSDHGRYHKSCIISEIFQQKAYERFFEVEENDVVIDFGSSIGPFTYSILNKNPSRIFCIEPSEYELETLKKNVGVDKTVIINKAISSRTGKVSLSEVFGADGNPIELDAISFPDLIKQENISKIDFLKTDCEGGEYDIFNTENIWWIKNNVNKIVGEWHLHLRDVDLTHKFREFRDIYLKLFPKHEVFSIDGVNIKWDLWNEHFIEYYRHILIYIDNR
jgi:FkbM family methyltransferase